MVDLQRVAIPSNRVNVSYQCLGRIMQWCLGAQARRNLLKSGQCFLPGEVKVTKKDDVLVFRSQSPQIGSMFLTTRGLDLNQLYFLMWSQSPQIGSMFLTN